MKGLLRKKSRNQQSGDTSPKRNLVPNLRQNKKINKLFALINEENVEETLEYIRTANTKRIREEAMSPVDNVTPCYRAVYLNLDKSILEAIYDICPPALMIKTPTSLLHVAASNASYVMCEYLAVLMPELLSLEDTRGYLPLHCAVVAQKVENVWILLKLNMAAKFLRDRLGYSTLSLSGEHPHPNPHIPTLLKMTQVPDSKVELDRVLYSKDFKAEDIIIKPKSTKNQLSNMVDAIQNREWRMFIELAESLPSKYLHKSIIKRMHNISWQRTLLHDVIYNKCPLEVVETLLKLDSQRSPEIVSLTERKESLEYQVPLHLAAATCNVELVQCLAAYNPKVLKFTDKNAQTCLHKAAVSNPSPEVLGVLVNMGADVTEQDNDEKTAIDLFIETHSNNPDFDVCKSIIELPKLELLDPLQLPSKDIESTFLDEENYKQNFSSTEEYKAFQDEYNSLSEVPDVSTSYRYSVSMDDRSVDLSMTSASIPYLSNKQLTHEDLREYAYKLLDYQGQSGEKFTEFDSRSQELIRALIAGSWGKAEGCINKQSATGVVFLPLHVAAKHTAPIDLFSKLVEAYPEGLLQRDPQNGETPLNVLCSKLYITSYKHYSGPYVEHVAELIMSILIHPKGIESASLADNKGNLPLHNICSILHPVHLCYSDEQPPLDEYFRLKSYQSVALAQVKLIQVLMGVAPESIKEINSKRRTPLHLLVRNGAVPKIVKIVLDYYPPAASMVDARGHIPLHYAALKCVNLGVLKLLLRAAPHTAYTENDFGSTPMFLAASSAHPSKLEIVGLIKTGFAPHTRKTVSSYRRATISFNKGGDGTFNYDGGASRHSASRRFSDTESTYSEDESTLKSSQVRLVKNDLDRILEDKELRDAEARIKSRRPSMMMNAAISAVTRSSRDLNKKNNHHDDDPLKEVTKRRATMAM